ncbi:hypothetical protein DB31_1260 [Hyalangium minutum]|uniref:Uncharacterized protein n=1 Tax=Hyalangium minutum TaxID=394096 RepID=A0A085WET2_9BACT|nr:hypothetical protein DB31_1260 [Hyalangium minutum]
MTGELGVLAFTAGDHQPPRCRLDGEREDETGANPDLVHGGGEHGAVLLCREYSGEHSQAEPEIAAVPRTLQPVSHLGAEALCFQWVRIVPPTRGVGRFRKASDPLRRTAPGSYRLPPWTPRALLTERAMACPPACPLSGIP